MKLVAIPKSVLAPFPKPASKAVVSIVREAIANNFTPQPQKLQGPFTTINIPDDIVAALPEARGYLASYVVSAILESGIAPVEAPTPPPPPPPPPMRATKQQQEWREAIEHRLRVARMDAQLGRWARFFITGGNPAVEMCREDGDFSDEIAAGAVVREIIPHEYTKSEAAAWRDQRMRAGDIVVWMYIDAESESLVEASEAKARAEARMQGGDAVDAVDQVERAEAIQKKIFGYKTGFLKLAAADAKTLGHRAPDNIKALAARAEKIGIGKNLLTSETIRHRLLP